MKFGVYLINPPNLEYTPGDPTAADFGSDAASITSPGYLRDCARYADELGFDSIWFPDHVVIPAKYDSRYPYQPYEGDEYKRYPYDETAFPEPFTAMAYVAGATERIKLRTGVIILPERNPVLFAKQLATLDALSGGRLELGIGIGWLREEFEALGIPWANRGRRCDEYIEAMRALWTNDVASYDGEFVSFQDIRCDPKPAQPGGVPLIVGGHSHAAARRAGRYGDGFLPLGEQQITTGFEFLETMRQAAEEAGRDPDAIEISAGGGPDVDYIGQLAEGSVDHVFLQVWQPSIEATRETLQRIAEDIIPKFR